MARRSVRQRRKSGFDHGTLETRRVLTRFIDIGDAFVPDRASNFHIPINESQVVAEDLDEAPDISVEPENGELEYRESDGVLTYTPNDGSNRSAS